MHQKDLRREILNDDINLRSIAILPSSRDLSMWRDGIEFRKARGFLAWPGTIGRIEGFNEMGTCLAQGIRARPDVLRKAWANAWPEHVACADAAIHGFDKGWIEDDVSYRFQLSAYKTKLGLLSKKYVAFVELFFPGGKMPLGFAPAKSLQYALGRANLVMAGQEVPYRSVKAALSDNVM